MRNWEEIFNRFKEKKILVIGDIILDMFTYVKCERMNPEQPAAPLGRVIESVYVLGGAGNVANNLVSLNANCSLYGIIGEDQAGKKIKELCVQRGINLQYFYNQEPTILKQRIIEKEHGRYLGRYDRENVVLPKINCLIEEEIIGFLKKEIKEYNFIILSDYNKYLFNENLTKRIIDLANLEKIPVLVDPKPENWKFFKNCTIVRPNQKEAEKITGIKYENGKDILKKMAEVLVKKINAKYAIITCGKDGSFSYDKDKQEALLVETKAREVRDVTGAGDTFAAVLSLALASGLEIHDAVKLANYASGIVVEKVGTAVPTIEEIKRNLYKDIY